ncbi:MAG: sigma-70 family RNA polymerase sigma factor [Polyangiaceae bacterium]|nr:sigma-70 family RNA polymerase sigma factor [Polyangiaceae bacterium]
MSTSAAEEIERTVRRLCDAGDRAGAATAAIRGYGPEVYGFLLRMHRSDQDADDVFAIWSERVWRSLEGFAWDSSLRTWAYVIARNASYNHRRDARVRADRAPSLPETSQLEEIQAEVRSETRPYQRTEAKDKLAQLRESLPPEDRLLLVLRVDRDLEWKDLARVTLGVEEHVDDAVLARESQRLRKRFQHVKERLVELGVREGMLRRG